MFPSKLYVTFIDFSKRLAYEVIFNDVDETDQDRVAKEGSKTRSKTQHYLVIAPPL